VTATHRPRQLADVAAAGARSGPAHRAYRNLPRLPPRHSGCTEGPECVSAAVRLVFANEPAERLAGLGDRFRRALG
jgi:hypothetical protein